MQDNEAMASKNEYVQKVGIGIPVYNNPLITTIIPTYRRPKLLQRAINSVLNQAYPHFQVCVCDNASGDETEAAVAEIAKNDSRVKYHRHPENIGAFNNFQHGLKNVRTEFFSILSDDDVICPEFYETAIQWFEKYPEAEFVSMGVLNCNSWGDIFSDGAMSGCKNGLYKPFEGLMKMLLHKPPTWTGTLFRKSILKTVGFLDSEVGFAGDMDFMLRAAAKVPFVYDSRPGGIFIPMSLVKNNSSRGSIDDILPGWHKIIDHLTNNAQMPDETVAQISSILKAQIPNRLFQMGIVAILRGDYDNSLKASQILRIKFDRNTSGNFLYLVSKMCHYLPLVRHILLRLYDARSCWDHYNRKNSSKREYSQFYPLLKV